MDIKKLREQLSECSVEISMAHAQIDFWDLEIDSKDDSTGRDLSLSERIAIIFLRKAKALSELRNTITDLVSVLKKVENESKALDYHIGTNGKLINDVRVSIRMAERFECEYQEKDVQTARELAELRRALAERDAQLAEARRQVEEAASHEATITNYATRLEQQLSGSDDPGYQQYWRYNPDPTLTYIQWLQRAMQYLEEAAHAGATGENPDEYLATKAPTTLRNALATATERERVLRSENDALHDALVESQNTEGMLRRVLHPFAEYGKLEYCQQRPNELIVNKMNDDHSRFVEIHNIHFIEASAALAAVEQAGNLSKSSNSPSGPVIPEK